MKQILLFLLFSVLFACTNAEVAETPTTIPTLIPTQLIPSNTPLSPTFTLIPSITPTIEIPCDPLRVDFCVADGHFILQRPIRLPATDLVDITYRYGSTANGTREPHHGVEFPNASGTPVYAAAEGTVVFARPDKEAIYAPWGDFYGNLIVIEHKDALFTLYAHLSKIDVEEGQKVFVGDKLGEVGSTGVAIGSHLHFEVRQGDGQDYFATQNPELWLVPAKDGSGNLLGTLRITVMDQNSEFVKHAEFTLQFYEDKSSPPVKSYYGVTYPAEMLNGEENAALGDLPAGLYRITIDWDGRIYERWVEVESGKLTEVVFAVK